MTKLLYEEARILCNWLNSEAMDEYGVFYMNDQSAEGLLAELEDYIYCRMPLDAMPVHEEDWEAHGVGNWEPESFEASEWEEDDVAVSGGS